MKLKPISNISCFIALFLSMCILVACSKSTEAPDDLPKEDDPVVPVDNGMFYKLIRVESMAGDTTQYGDPLKEKEDFFFSLEKNKRFDVTYTKTSQWDLGFTGIHNVGISCNNGTDRNNFGYGNQARGGIAVIEKPFDEVTEVPADIVFKLTKSGVNLDANGDFGDGIGWVLYDFGGGYLGDGTAEKMHVAYALGNPVTLRDGTIVPARTLIVRTANGNLAKIKMISMYKNAFTPDKWFKDTPHPFFTFEYVMIPKGETKFQIK